MAVKILILVVVSLFSCNGQNGQSGYHEKSDRWLPPSDIVISPDSKTDYSVSGDAALMAVKKIHHTKNHIFAYDVELHGLATLSYDFRLLSVDPLPGQLAQEAIRDTCGSDENQFFATDYTMYVLEGSEARSLCTSDLPVVSIAAEKDVLVFISAGGNKATLTWVSTSGGEILRTFDISSLDAFSFISQHEYILDSPFRHFLLSIDNGVVAIGHRFLNDFVIIDANEIAEYTYDVEFFVDASQSLREAASKIEENGLPSQWTVLTTDIHYDNNLKLVLAIYSVECQGYCLVFNRDGSLLAAAMFSDDGMLPFDSSMKVNDKSVTIFSTLVSPDAGKVLRKGVFTLNSLFTSTKGVGARPGSNR